jgi:hypothetical protein
MVMSELTWGVDGAGLLVLLVCSMEGPYIDPDQQGDSISSVMVFDSLARESKSRWNDLSC